MILHCSIYAVNGQVMTALRGRPRLMIAPTAPSRTTGKYNLVMYIIALAWLYVTVLMALTETSVVAGILSLLFYGLLPIALLLWLFGGRVALRRARRTPDQPTSQPDHANQDMPEH